MKKKYYCIDLHESIISIELQVKNITVIIINKKRDKPTVGRDLSQNINNYNC